MRFPTLFCSIAIAAAMFACAGCGHIIESAMVDAPNGARSIDRISDTPPHRLRLLGVDRQFRVQVGPPEASLLVWVLEPERDASESSADTATPSVPPTPRGTILVLHGYRNEAFWMLPTARRLAAAGYRVALYDLRGQGSSTGKTISFGVLDGSDLSQVLDALDERGLLVEPVGTYGLSYGGTVAIQGAARDERVKAVVSVATFASMREIAPHVIRTALPMATPIMTTKWIDERIDAAGKRGQFDPAEADTTRAIARTDTPVLIIHGTGDRVVPVSHAHELYRAGKPHNRLVILKDVGHVDIYFDRSGRVYEETVSWFGRHLRRDAR